MQIAAQFSFDQRGAANHGVTAEVAFRGQVHFAVRANGAAKTRRDFVILQIDVRTARGTNRRARGGADFLFRFAFETLNL